MYKEAKRLDLGIKNEMGTHHSYTCEVSVCVPVYNGQKYLQRCLYSIICQTYKDIEILIIDDNSSDDSYRLISQFSFLDSRVRIYRNDENLGLVRNWNKCIMLSRGNWIKFVFQDDWIHPECIEIMQTTAQKTDRSFIACNREFVFEDKDDPSQKFYLEIVKHLPKLYEQEMSINHVEFSNLILHYLLNNRVSSNFVGEPTNMLIRKDAICEVGLFKTDLIQSCDYEYWSRMGINFGIHLIPEVLSWFRIHKTSTTIRNKKRHLLRKRYLDLLAVLHDYLFLPVYLPFRDAIGKKNCDKVRNYAEKLFRSAMKTMERANISADATADFRFFLRNYPIFAELLDRRTSRQLSNRIRKYKRFLFRR